MRQAPFYLPLKTKANHFGLQTTISFSVLSLRRTLTYLYGLVATPKKNLPCGFGISSMFSFPPSKM